MITVQKNITNLTVSESKILFTLTNASPFMTVTSNPISLNINQSKPVIEIPVYTTYFSITNPVIELSVVPKGEKGSQGDKGDIGGVFEHLQAVPSNVWNVLHNLGFHPNVSVVDSTQRKVLTDIEYIDFNNLNILTESAFSGKAFLS